MRSTGRRGSEKGKCEEKKTPIKPKSDEKGSRRTGKTGQKCGKAAPLLKSADGLPAAPEKRLKTKLVLCINI